VVEEMLAQRVVSLSWRLRRAERLQSAVFATVYRENADDVVLWPKHGLPIQPGPGEDEVVLGQVVMTDFARAQVLDRLLVYERRIESSLYRTMGELRREREQRQAHAAAMSEEISRSEGSLAAGQRSVTPGKLGSFDADAAPGVQAQKTAFEGSEPPAGIARGMGFQPMNHRQSLPPTRSGDAHVTGAPKREKSAFGEPPHGQDARATGTPAGIQSSCETKPIRREFRV
jgi:hypothetical protein